MEGDGFTRVTPRERQMFRERMNFFGGRPTLDECGLCIDSVTVPC